MIQLFDAFGESAETFCDYSMRCAYKRPLLPIFFTPGPAFGCGGLECFGPKIRCRRANNLYPEGKCALDTWLKDAMYGCRLVKRRLLNFVFFF